MMTLRSVLSQLDRYHLTGLHIQIISLQRHLISGFIHHLYNNHTLCLTNKLAHTWLNKDISGTDTVIEACSNGKLQCSYYISGCNFHLFFHPFSQCLKHDIGSPPLSAVNHLQKQCDRVLLVMQCAAGIHTQQILERIAAVCNIRFDKRFTTTLMIQ